MSTTVARVLSLLVLAPLVACGGGGTAQTAVDARVEVSPDATDARPPDADTSGPLTGCTAAHHACGTTCVPDAANTPDVGCALGCGEACPATTNGAATCSTSGLCDVTCDEGFTRVGDLCVDNACQAVGYTCGMYQAIDCGTCIETGTCGANHTCDIPRDALEVNDTLAQATQLGDFNDADDRSVTHPGLSIDSPTDEDWFQFHVTDGFDFGNPDAYVQLTHTDIVSGTDLGWLSAPHELTVWFKCDGGDAGSTVACGEWGNTEATNTLNDPALGIGCTVEGTYVVWAHASASCATTDDNGVVTARVRKTEVPMGDTYDLGVRVE